MFNSSRCLYVILFALLMDCKSSETKRLRVKFGKLQTNIIVCNIIPSMLYWPVFEALRIYHDLITE